MTNNVFQSLSHPSNGAAVTPNDSADLPRSGILYVGTGGSIAITTVGGDTLTLTGVPSGSWIPVRVKRVFATGTTASGMDVFYDKYD
jgi:hypothetical protein